MHPKFRSPDPYEVRSDRQFSPLRFRFQRRFLLAIREHLSDEPLAAAIGAGISVSAGATQTRASILPGSRRNAACVSRLARLTSRSKFKTCSYEESYHRCSAEVVGRAKQVGQTPIRGDLRRYKERPLVADLAKGGDALTRSIKLSSNCYRGAPRDLRSVVNFGLAGPPEANLAFAERPLLFRDTLAPPKGSSFRILGNNFAAARNFGHASDCGADVNTAYS